MKFQFGHIPWIKIGQLFKDKTTFKNAGINVNTIKGIWGAGTSEWSMVLSGGYLDDKNLLE